MREGIRLCAGAVLLAACAVDPGPATPSRVALGGSSALVARFAQAARETGVPAELLAATSYVTTRFAAGAGHGFALPPDDLRAAAALITPGATTLADYLPALERAGGAALGREVAAALTRGILGRDESGATIVVAAQPVATVRTGGMAADYPGATWQAASASNFQVGSRTAIDHLVIHDTEGSFSGTVGWFQNSTAQVSAHYVVKSSDGEIVQMVAEKDIAWHDKCFNATTIGIEHEGYEAHPDVWYTEAMYVQSAKLTAHLADKYGIAKEHGPILGHGEAPDCSDHTDPGPGWNWAHYIDLVKTGGAPHFDASEGPLGGPLVMTSGEVVDVSATLTNTGNAAWDLDLTRLGTAEPADRDSAFFVPGAWASPSRAATVTAVVPPGGDGTFAFPFQAPVVTTPTMFDEAFQLVEEGMGAFGPVVHFTVMVSPTDATSCPQCNDTGAAGCNAARGSGMLPGLAALGLALRSRRRRRV